MAQGKSVLVCLSIGLHFELPLPVMQRQTLLPSLKYLSLSVKVPSGSLWKIAENEAKYFPSLFFIWSEATFTVRLWSSKRRLKCTVLYLYDILMTLRLYLYSMLGRSRQSEPGRWGIFEILAWTRLESFRQMWSRQTCSIDPSSNPLSLNETKQIYSRLSQKQTKLLYKCKKNVTVCNNDENKLEMAWPINDFRLKSGRKWPMNNRYLK